MAKPASLSVAVGSAKSRALNARSFNARAITRVARALVFVIGPPVTLETAFKHASRLPGLNTSRISRERKAIERVTRDAAIRV
jgi:hypothetical protein